MPRWHQKDRDVHRWRWRASSVRLEDFYIRSEQCGIPAPKFKDAISEAHALVFEDYAILSAANDKKRRDYYQQREAKRQWIFGRFRGTSTNSKQSKFDVLDAVTPGFSPSPAEETSSTGPEDTTSRITASATAGPSATANDLSASAPSSS